jgi:hypothetical protein
MLAGIRKWLEDSRGQSFVEFALILPIAMLLVFAVVDLGKATSYWLDSSHLANEAARSAAVNGCPTDPLSPLSPCNPGDPVPNAYVDALVTAIKNQAETTQLRGDVNVCIWDLTGNAWAKNDEIHLEVSSLYTFLPILNVLSHTVTGRSTMRLETTWLSPPTANPYGVGPTPCPATPTNP